MLKRLDPSFKEAAEAISAGAYPTRSILLPFYDNLLDRHQQATTDAPHNGHVMHEAAERAHSKLKQFYDKNSEASTLATVLGPRRTLGYSQDRLQRNTDSVVVRNKFVEECLPRSQNRRSRRQASRLL